jgi:hypothetical protein
MPLILLLIYISQPKHIQKQEVFILGYSIFNVILFGITDILSVNHKHNMPLYHLQSLVELWLVTFYMMYKITGKKFSKEFYIIGSVYTLFFACNIIFWEDISVFNSNSAGVSSLVILFLSMYYLLKLSKTDEILYFQKLPSFWIASGFLIYNAVSVLVLLSYKYFTYIHMEKMGDRLWFVLSAAIIAKFALISIGLLCHRKRPVIHSPFLL